MHSSSGMKESTERIGNQTDLLSTAQAGLYPEYETESEKLKRSAPGHICSICGGVGRLRIDAPYGDPSFGKSVACRCSEERQKSLLLQQRRKAANMEALRTITFKTFNNR